MPFSHDRFDEQMKSAIKHCAFDSWLDIGAGAGKHGRMVRDVLPNANIVGIEPELDYINKYELPSIYDRVRPINTMDLLYEPKQTYDGIIIGDVIEHLPKSQGVDLINFLIYRCKRMFIVYPIERVQNGYKDSQHEAHISVWGVSDWQLFEYDIIKHQKSHFVIVRGFIDDID